jgi:hypothetical protein
MESISPCNSLIGCSFSDAAAHWSDQNFFEWNLPPHATPLIGCSFFCSIALMLIDLTKISLTKSSFNHLFAAPEAETTFHFAGG